MDLLDRLLGHDAWTTHHLLERCREVDEEGLHRRFDLGRGTLHETLVHVVRALEGWLDLMHERSVRPRQALPAEVTVDRLIERFDDAAAELGVLARRIRDENRWDDTFVDVLDDPPRAKSFGGAIVHLTTHGMAHRTEILHMLARLGVPDLIEGDAMSWDRRQRAG